MSVNSSSSCNAPLPPPYSWWSPDIILYQQLQCLCMRTQSPNTMAVMAAYILLVLPLNVLVLYLIYQRWRSPSTTTMTHSDLLNVHMSIMELISVLGSVLSSFGVYTNTTVLVIEGIALCLMNLIGVMIFHVLTCVEHHLAVVHPVMYLGLKNAKGIRMRNITIGVVWLISFGGCFSLFLSVENFIAITFYMLGFDLVVVCFCSLSVLCVLVRPGPADRFGHRQQVDQSKLRAFHTITVILCLLLFKFGGYILVFTLYTTHVVDTATKCYLWISLFWFCLPSNLVLPMLFLHRARKLCCCKTRQQSH